MKNIPLKLFPKLEKSAVFGTASTGGKALKE
jgi:hypothetical protein